jgi:hypothetical protein
LWLIIFNEFSIRNEISVRKWQGELVHGLGAKQAHHRGTRVGWWGNVQGDHIPLFLTDDFEAREILFP